jgi:two-component system chemotaxis sensor kinase CheA
MSHQAFREGGTIPGGDGKPVYLEPVVSSRGRELEEKVDVLWKPYFALLQPLLAGDNFTPQELAARWPTARPTTSSCWAWPTTS